jgi:cytochrome b involved in lipid metabolism
LPIIIIIIIIISPLSGFSRRAAVGTSIELKTLMSTIYSYEEVRRHNTESDLWIVIRGKVYAFPPAFIHSHPGGPVLLDAAGIDGSNLFEDGPHGDSAREQLQHYLVGIVQR